jgi:hypothetical protein
MRETVMSQTYEMGDRVRFARFCRTWEDLNVALCTLNSKELLRLMRYLLETRPSNKTYLKRVVARFNVVNKLKVEDLYHERKQDTGVFKGVGDSDEGACV